jgi:hypothetical protein
MKIKSSSFSSLQQEKVNYLKSNGNDEDSNL